MAGIGYVTLNMTLMDTEALEKERKEKRAAEDLLLSMDSVFSSYEDWLEEYGYSHSEHYDAEKEQAHCKKVEDCCPPTPPANPNKLTYEELEKDNKVLVNEILEWEKTGLELGKKYAELVDENRTLQDNLEDALKSRNTLIGIKNNVADRNEELVAEISDLKEKNEELKKQLEKLMNYCLSRT